MKIQVNHSSEIYQISGNSANYRSNFNAIIDSIENCKLRRFSDFSEILCDFMKLKQQIKASNFTKSL